MTPSEIQTHLPLTEATFFILLSLAPQSKHGYAIMQEVQHLSDDRVTLSTGTLYGALKRLLQQGWIERVDEGESPATNAPKTGRPRKAYTLTDLGRRVLAAEVERLQSLVSMARVHTAGGQA